jgi:hypothetical protein
VKAAIKLTALLLLIASVALGQSAGETGLSDNAYTVISVFLRTQLSRKNDADAIRIGYMGSVIAPETLNWKVPISAQDKSWMKRELSGIGDDTLASFERCAAVSVPFGSRLSLPLEYQIVTPEESRSLNKLYAKIPYPKRRGLLRFSCVGWNTAETQALFFVERTFCRCGVGKFILMEKTEAQNWIIKAEMLRWIA